MDNEMRCRLKLKLPSGTEFEAEGSREFVLSERERFLAQLPHDEPRTVTETPVHGLPELMPPKPIEKAGEVWRRISLLKDNFLILKIKHPQINAQEAALIIIGANRAICDTDSMPALTLSKALRKSGYITDRLDRLLAQEITAGRLMPLGTKRNRAYHLSDKGLARAYILAEKLAERSPSPTPDPQPQPKQPDIQNP